MSFDPAPPGAAPRQGLAPAATSAAVPPRIEIAALDRQSYADWPSIFAGAALATAVSFLMLTFGAGLGLSIASPEPREGVSAPVFAIAAGLWFLWVAVSSFGAGGYLAGRLRRRADDADADERETRDGAHGLVVWAVGAVLATVMAASGLAGALGVAGSAATTAAEAAGSAGGGVAGRLIEEGAVDLDYEASVLLRSDSAAGAAASGDAAAEIATILGRALRDGEIAPADRTYLASRLAEWTGVSQDAAASRIDGAVDRLAATREAAVDAADTARRAGIVAAFAAAAAMVAAAAAAWFGAALGGAHRDAGVFISPRQHS